MNANVEESTVENFRSGLRGELLLPGDDGYDTARRIWNATVDKHPAMIARCAGAADVISAVNFARTHGLLLAVRGGGHNVAGKAVCDGGIVIDLSVLKGIRVDPVRRTAHAQPGLTWREFDHETQAFGLATTGGIVSTTGIAGLTLGGGLGIIERTYGLTCDNLLSVDIVTADGQLLTASATQHADLFWGVRGGGGNFGVVTAFEYQLHPLREVLGGMLVYPFEKARDVLRFHRDFSLAAPDELAVPAALVTSPEGAPLLGIVVCYTGPRERGEQLIRPLREYGPPAADHVGPLPYLQIQRLIDDAFPAGLRNYWISSFLEQVTDDGIDIILKSFRTVPSPQSIVIIEQMGGAVKRVPQDATPFNNRDSDYNLLIMSIWRDATDDEVNIRWARELWSAMQPFVSGVYVNYLGDQEADRIKSAYGPEKYERLVALKNKYDPTNLFRLNQNIPPTV